jgi:hypothetical protein
MGRRLSRVACALLLGGASLVTQAQESSQQAPPPVHAGVTPFARGEVLNYNVSWPSGLSLGEARFAVGTAEPGWDFEFHLDASMPALAIRDEYRASADAQFCALKLEKDVTHGARKTKETVRYNRSKHVAERQTDSGGKSEVSVPDCVKDGLSFLYLLRRELANGRVAAGQTINFGAPYQISVTYTDSPKIEIGGEQQQADHLQVSLRGPASSHTFEVFVGRDAARTPLLIRVPFSLGTFALEIAR